MHKNILIYIIGFLLLTGFTKSHPFYLSLIELNQNTKEQTIEISIRIFADDFEANLAKLYPQQKVDLQNVSNKAINDKLIFDYINKKLQVSTNSQPKKLQYVGYEIQQESVWIYVETPQVSNIKTLLANCTIMFDYHEKQINIFRAKINGVEKNTKLDNPKSTVSFSW